MVKKLWKKKEASDLKETELEKYKRKNNIPDDFPFPIILPKSNKMEIKGRDKGKGKGIFTNGKYVLDKEKQHEFRMIYIIPFIGVFFLPILFFSSKVSMFGKTIAFIIQFCLSFMILCLLMLYLAFFHGR